ncbi:MAG: heme exporter protein CcmD [Gammaproteobacteria bacterium]|nr:heme exporter protein CcmD [Gammaproteobacteria bacterium]
MDSWHEFWTMGGYARFVWPAYGVAFVVLLGSGWAAHRGLRRALARVASRVRGGRR